MFFLISQIFGTVAAFIIIASFQFKDVRKLLGMQIVSSALFALQFLFLGAYAGLACNIVGAGMRVAVYFRQKRGTLPGEAEGKSPFFSPWFWGFVLLFAGAGIATYDGVHSLIPTLAMCVFTYATWNADPKFIRKMNFFVCSPLWLTYNIFTLAVAGIVTETMNMVSVAVSWFRFFANKKQK